MMEVRWRWCSFGVQQLSHSTTQQNPQTERLHSNLPLFCSQNVLNKVVKIAQKKDKKKTRKNRLNILDKKMESKKWFQKSGIINLIHHLASST